MSAVRFFPGAVAALASTPAVRDALADEAEGVRDRARIGASRVSSRLSSAIVTEEGTDREGAFVDIGYDKRRSGWVLWFAEVGTAQQPATPHLRPALRR